jgi:serine/threonine-protein kinase
VTASRRERRLNAAIAEYLKAVQAGRPPDRREFLQRHWDLTDGLVSFFDDEDRLRRLAGLCRPAARTDCHSRGLRPRPGWEVEIESGRDFGSFELLNEIASGGMGIVFKARDKKLNRIVALKTVRPGPPRYADEAIRRLRIEARLIASLDHPNIVPIYEIGEHRGYPYVIFKLVPGGDLERHVPRFTRDPRAAARLMARVARTIHFAHRRGILHRDLKPSNILLDLKGRPHVTDFGLAKCVEAETHLTPSGFIIGTPSYMAPEQVSGPRSIVTASADIYGLGAVLYKLLIGRPPFQAETVFETLQQVLDRQPPPLRSLNPRIDRDLEAICLKCLEKDPIQRYDSAAALAHDLEHWLAGERVSARSAGDWKRVRRWCQHHRAVVACAAALVGLVVTFVAAVVATATAIF